MGEMNVCVSEKRERERERDAVERERSEEAYEPASVAARGS